ncbi:PLP-dependent transferase [Xylona heveae TC161]|uniref:PLP-dependent transferase n=1 Tax=Xylona heveae (strain CBS 132557 / TC161) TaxID=1328760 RepID=A0A165GPU9_XYLHT|nr:PLP-dependent transferase [Xylona heveae TC161]KZF22447.1 PLP-dependent transferase [Xylona heveae TC161]
MSHNGGTTSQQLAAIPDTKPDASVRAYAPETQAIHADDHLNTNPDVAPALHVSTTFRYTEDPEKLRPVGDDSESLDESHIYSRVTAPNTTRLESILSTLLKGRAVTYSSGLSALHAALVFLNPKKISIGDGYHGCHGVVDLQQRLTGMKKLPLDCAAEELGPGDVIHLETPVNPTGLAFNIQKFAEKAHSRGAYLVVDATFGPPGLQDPFAHGADIIMHSGTKYIGGHSDMLCGVLATQREDWWKVLLDDRTYLGSVLGSFEGWLGIRSVRTLELRVRRQSDNASRLVAWLDAMVSGRPDQTPGNDAASSSANAALVRKIVARVAHASLQHDDKAWLDKQMPNGYGPVFSMWATSEAFARALPSRLKLFHHATSLGGVESLIEWRRMSDKGVVPTLLRVSVGVESWEDIRDDLLQGFKALAGEATS